MNNPAMSAKAVKLDRNFYLRPTLEVASDLLGKYLVYEGNRGILSVRLVEVEAYIGENDPACHAARGMTDRNRVMFGLGGFAYIYFIYGMYHCLNVVTEVEGFPAAVLIRAGEPVEGVDIMESRFDNKKSNLLTNGPGKLCKAFALTRDQNGLDLTGDKLYLEDRCYKPYSIKCKERIGIKVGLDKDWRLIESSSRFVSGKKR